MSGWEDRKAQLEMYDYYCEETLFGEFFIVGPRILKAFKPYVLTSDKPPQHHPYACYAIFRNKVRKCKFSAVAVRVMPMVSTALYYGLDKPRIEEQERAFAEACVGNPNLFLLDPWDYIKSWRQVHGVD